MDNQQTPDPSAASTSSSSASSASSSSSASSASSASSSPSFPYENLPRDIQWLVLEAMTGNDAVNMARTSSTQRALAHEVATNPTTGPIPTTTIYIPDADGGNAAVVSIPHPSLGAQLGDYNQRHARVMENTNISQDELRAHLREGRRLRGAIGSYRRPQEGETYEGIRQLQLRILNCLRRSAATRLNTMIYNEGGRWGAGQRRR